MSSTVRVYKTRAKKVATVIAGDDALPPKGSKLVEEFTGRRALKQALSKAREVEGKPPHKAPVVKKLGVTVPQGLRSRYQQIVKLANYGIANECNPAKVFKIVIRAWNARELAQAKEIEKCWRELVTLVGDDTPDWELVEGGELGSIKRYNKEFHKWLYRHEMPWIRHKSGVLLYNPEMLNSRPVKKGKK